MLRVWALGAVGATGAKLREKRGAAPKNTCSPSVQLGFDTQPLGCQSPVFHKEAAFTKMAKHAVVGRGTGGTEFKCDDVKVLKESHDTVVAMEALLTTCVGDAKEREEKRLAEAKRKAEEQEKRDKQEAEKQRLLEERKANAGRAAMRSYE
ncbi:hypothetical protein AK812_SmicGene802 [Symbiodinium microadriaticum]|uniref:Uncharacterized protein n=1 Tax=Symbiodinium microadriaticum TaxID=2951 RepID=A0A1Q9F5N9_SYMMI|nr:hypothetical protein AK812_SmicGene802 [Symbiodinium microadriaticum]